MLFPHLCRFIIWGLSLGIIWWILLLYFLISNNTHVLGINSTLVMMYCLCYGRVTLPFLLVDIFLPGLYPFCNSAYLLSSLVFFFFFLINYIIFQTQYFQLRLLLSYFSWFTFLLSSPVFILPLPINLL